jgi:hypothetical protein
MGANNSVPAELAAQCHLSPDQVKHLVKAFQKKNKKGKPINKEVFMHVLGKLDYSLRAKSPLLVNHENLDILYSTLDVNHDGTRTHGATPTRPRLVSCADPTRTRTRTHTPHTTHHTRS